MLLGIIFRYYQVLLPNLLQWVLFIAISIPGLEMTFISTEWLYCTLIWWYFGTLIDVAYALSLVSNQFIHAETRLRCFGGRRSVILQRE
jgi:hypothetical protein